jgi:hypothetical protein
MSDPKGFWSFESKDFFEPKEFRDFQPPRPTDDASSQATKGFFVGLVVLIVLSLIQGSLVWAIFRMIEQVGFIDNTGLPWGPFVSIALAVNLIRVFDKAAFTRK